LLVTAIFTGLRASELRGLTWEAVDLERKVLTVRPIAGAPARRVTNEAETAEQRRRSTVTRLGMPPLDDQFRQKQTDG
jgi:integrase